MPNPLGPLMMDVAGPALDGEDRDLAVHPAIGGVVLFARNFVDREQLAALNAELHALRSPPLLLAVDHEGGRVQRFHAGFTDLPAARRIGVLHDRDPARARAIARAVGLVAAFELRRTGFDLDFAPVLDLGGGNEETIGARAFHADPGVVTALARSWLDGAARAGFAGVGKHFPGHGTARGDTHVEGVVDERPLAALRAADLRPFAALAPRLGGMMTGHLRLPEVDPAPVTFSRRWLRGVLGRDLGFTGIVFSDDLSMGAAAGSPAGNESRPGRRNHGAPDGRAPPEAKAAAALAAGCDVALLLNDRAGLVRVLDGWRPGDVPATRDPGRLRPAGRPSAPTREYRRARALLEAFSRTGPAGGPCAGGRGTPPDRRKIDHRGGGEPDGEE